MSDPRLPPEISDYIVDFLRDQPETLKPCCLVSKSWVPRARKHLFGEIVFRYLTRLKAWKKTFQDPANSPAHYTRSLSIGTQRSIVSMVTEGDSWIRAFCNVVKLELLNVCGPLSSLRLFICSLPHLEDLTVSRVRIAKEDDNTTFQPLTSPPLTGTLTISRPRRVERLVTWLLELPNEIHFRKFRFLWDRAQEVQWVMNFVHACSSTLEHADFEHQVDEPEETCEAIDLSNATKLTSVIFRFDERSVSWVTTALKYITSKHRDLREVTFHIYITAFVGARRILGDRICALWMDLDHALVQLSESGAVHVRARCYSSRGDKQTREHIEGMLPEAAKGGITTLVVSSGWHPC